MDSKTIRYWANTNVTGDNTKHLDDAFCRALTELEERWLRYRNFLLLSSQTESRFQDLLPVLDFPIGIKGLRLTHQGPATLQHLITSSHWPRNISPKFPGQTFPIPAIRAHLGLDALDAHQKAGFDPKPLALAEAPAMGTMLVAFTEGTRKGQRSTTLVQANTSESWWILPTTEAVHFSAEVLVQLKLFSFQPLGSAIQICKSCRCGSKV